MTTTHKHDAHRRLDLASLLLACIGVAAGAFSYWLVAAEHFNPLVLVPSVVAVTIGVTHLTKREIRRR